MKPARIFQPGKVGSDRTAHQDILFEVHGQAVIGKKFLQNPFKTKGFPAEIGDPVSDFLDFVYIILGQRRDILCRLCVGRDEHFSRQSHHHLKRVQVGRDIVEEADLIFVQSFFAGQAVCQIDQD